MKRSHRPSPETQRVQEAASRWFVRLRDLDGEMSQEDLQAWELFMEDPHNRAAFDSIQRVAENARGIRAPRRPSPQELASDRFDGNTSIEEWRAGPQLARRWRWWMGGVCATAAAVGISGLLIFGGAHPPARADLEEVAQVLATQAGEHRQVKLPDGSQVDLGASTTLSVRYTPQRRRLVLDHGEALFTVAHNRLRPFDVEAGSGTVTALGTVFDVKHLVDRTTVTVTEGVVEVRPPQAQSDSRSTAAREHPPTRLLKGQELTYAVSGVVAPIEAADVIAATEWREGRLVYRRVPMKYVVPDVNRYFQTQIIIGDSATGELLFTGAVFATQPVNEWLSALENIFPVQVTQTDAQHVLIRSRPRSGPELHSP